MADGNGKFGGGGGGDDTDDMACFAVFTHSSFLMTLFNGVFSCEKTLKRWLNRRKSIHNKCIA